MECRSSLLLSIATRVKAVARDFSKVCVAWNVQLALTLVDAVCLAQLRARTKKNVLLFCTSPIALTCLCKQYEGQLLLPVTFVQAGLGSCCYGPCSGIIAF